MKALEEIGLKRLQNLLWIFQLERIHYIIWLWSSYSIDIHTMEMLESVHPDLDLQSCLQLKEAAFLHIGGLQYLKRLNLYSTETSRNLLDTIGRYYTTLHGFSMLGT